MNIEEYISSGILEAYALGDLPERERMEVEENLRRYPQLQGELVAIEAAQEMLLMKAAISPRSKIKEAIRSAGKISLSEKNREVKLVVSNAGTITLWKYATAAAVSLAVLSTYFALDYRQRWSAASISLNELIARNQQLANDYNVVHQRLDNTSEALAVLGNPNYKRIVMTGTASNPQALAAVYWNAGEEDVYLSIRQLNNVAQDKQYQLWAIVDGKPVDAGVFDVNTKLLRMKNVSNASAFAVTIEPKGGSHSPTLETMQMIGKVS